jgi:hypothetical protein
MNRRRPSPAPSGHRIYNIQDIWDLLTSPRMTVSADDFRSMASLVSASGPTGVLAITARDGSRWGKAEDLVDVVFRYRPEVIETMKRTFGIDTWFVDKPIQRWVVRCRQSPDVVKGRIFDVLHPLFEVALDGNLRRVVKITPAVVPPGQNVSQPTFRNPSV